jgi:hypothetical protein
MPSYRQNALFGRFGILIYLIIRAIRESDILFVPANRSYSSSSYAYGFFKKNLTGCINYTIFALHLIL